MLRPHQTMRQLLPASTGRVRQPHHHCSVESIMITTNILEPGAIVEFILEGESALDEVLGIISSQYGKFSHGVLWNMINGSNYNLSANDMKRIALMVKKCAIHKKTAYICAKGVEFGLMRMYEAYALIEAVPPSMKVFHDRTAAIDWIYAVG
jgi:hypothetical protein